MYKRVFSLILCLALISTVFTGAISAASDGTTDDITAVYLSSSNGNDENSGTETDKPLKTLNAALNKVNELGLTGENRVINIIECGWNGLSFDMRGCTPYTEMITLKAKSGVTVWSTSDMYLGGPLTLNLNYGNSRSQKGMEIYTRGYDFTYDAKDEKGNSSIYAGYSTNLGIEPDETSGNIEWKKDIELCLAGEREVTLNKVIIGNSDYVNYNVVYGSADISIDNPNLTVTTLKLGNNGNFKNTGTQQNRFSNISVAVNNIKQIVSLEGATHYNAVKADSIQFIYNNGAAAAVTDKLVYGYYGNTNIQAGKKWIIKAAENAGFSLAATETPGSFELSNDSMAVAKSGDNAYYSNEGILTVPTGEYTVEQGAPDKVYINTETGSDSYNGISENAPLKTLQAAVNKVNSLGLKGENRVIYVKKCGWNGLSFDMSGCTPYEEPITLKSAGLTLWTTSHMKLAGPFVLDTAYGNSKSNSGTSIYTNGYDFTFGENAYDDKASADYPATVYGGYDKTLSTAEIDSTTGRVAYEKDCNIKIKTNRSFIIKLVIGNVQSIENAVQYGDANIVIDAPNAVIQQIFLGNNFNQKITINERMNRFNNFNLTVNNVGSIEKIGGATYYNGLYADNAQFIFNNGTYEKVTEGGDTLTFSNGYDGNNFTVNKKWIIKNEASGKNTYLNTTAIPGTFSVTGGNTVILSNNDNHTLSYISEKGNIKVPSGVYTMTVTGKEDYTFTGDVFTAVADLTGFNVTAIAPVQSNGRILLGFKNEKGEYLSNTADLNLSAGEKLYAVYSDFALEGENAAFRVSGAEERKEKKTGLRFIIEKGAAFETALAELSNIKYGYLALPEHFISLGETLTTDNENAAMKAVGDEGFVYYDGTDKFTVCITDIPEKHRGESFAVCGFVAYTDLNGNRRTAYSNTAYSSLLEVSANSVMNGDISETEKAEKLQLINDTLSSEKTALEGSIANSADTVAAAATGTLYYVSEKGSNANSGLSAQKPIKTLEKLSRLSLKAGDAVLFERGGVYRTSTKYSDGTSFRLTTGVSYGAYGTGTKPVINGSFENYAEKKWSRYSGNSNIWYINISNVSADPGVLRVTLKSNGYQYTGCVKESLSDLNKEWQFYWDGSKFYMYCQYGEPTGLLSNIDIGFGFDMFKIDGADNITVENLVFTCGGRHGIGAAGGTNGITVRGCEFSYIGGSVMSDSDGTRLGNAVEFLGDSTNSLVENCKFSNIYDSGVTFQGISARVSSFTVRNNIFDKCGLASFEYWLGTEGSAENIVIEKNLMYNAGNGYGGIENRTKAAVYVAHIRADGANRTSDFVIKNNVFDSAAAGAYLTALCCYKSSGGSFPTLSRNVYIRETGGELLSVKTGSADEPAVYNADAEGYGYLKQSIDRQPIVIFK